MKPVGSITLIVAALLLTGCASVEFDRTSFLRRMTYDLLRQEDCWRHDNDAFCGRTFLFEFDEYDRMRREFLTPASPITHEDNRDTANNVDRSTQEIDRLAPPTQEAMATPGFTTPATLPAQPTDHTAPETQHGLTLQL